MLALSPLIVILPHVTVLLLPTLASANVHVPLAVTVSPLITLLKPIEPVAFLFPSYVLVVTLLTLGVILFFPITHLYILFQQV